MAQIQDADNTKCWSLGGTQRVWPLWETFWWFLQMSSYRTIPQSYSFGVCPKEQKTCVHVKPLHRCYSSFIHIGQSLEAAKMPFSR